MYKGKKVILTTTACKRINLLKAAIKSFGIFCTDKHVIDEIHYYDDSSTSEERNIAMEYYKKYIPDITEAIQSIYMGRLQLKG